MLAAAHPTTAQTVRPRDPGVRGGDPGAGGPVTGLSANQLEYFNEGSNRFLEVDSVKGGPSNEEGTGLGPRFNLNSCAGCHAQPAVGGTSPATNPQVKVANLDGATNKVPFFVTSNGPVREARFVRNPDGTPDGSVHALFTIAGRSDAPAGCSAAVLPQPNFAAQAAAGNLVFRIPTPGFGGGLVQAISDDTLVDNLAANAPTKRSLGIAGHLNREANAGTVTRFGWKAQNKSLAIFAGEAYLVEQGVTNEMFTQERGEPGVRGDSARTEPDAHCLSNPTPEDATNFPASTGTGGMSDLQGFALFTQMLAAPQPAAFSTSASNGLATFNKIGCALCHTPTLKTGLSKIDALSNQTIQPYSDFAVHRMGSGLADNIAQGNAGGDEFRTAPLWGIGQRIFFLHDGRTRDLLQAIKAHASSGSEANAVVNNFAALSGSAQQDVLNFLRSL